MQKEYWLNRWEQEDIGFHQIDINHYLCQYWQELKLIPSSTVFVPLCGKSRDLLWLRKQGHPVLGVELSTLAIQTFFKENNQVPSHTSIRESFDCFENKGIRIFCGDFFNLTKEDVEKVNAVYDRASLVALPPEMRARYAHHLMHILPAATQILLITFDYPQSEMTGPPFAVSPDEIIMHYHKHANIQQLLQQDVLEQNPRFQERGLSRIQETVFLLTTHYKT